MLFREGRDFLGDLWEQRDPRANRGNAEMCGIKPLSVCYRDAGNTHTLLCEHSISQGTSRRKICKSVATRKIQDESYFVHHCVFVQFRERDELARILKAWMQPQSSSILISKAWDYRVRQHLGTRYNSKDGSFDWDLNMKLHEKGVFKSRLKSKNYRLVYYGQKGARFNLYSSPAVWRHPQTPVRPVEGEGRGL